MSKLVTAVAALRLVQDGLLNLDRDVKAELTEWHVPRSDMTDSHPVTLRGMLSMTAGIGVPGYLGYAPGTPLPNRTQVLDGVPPANSPPVRVEAVRGRRYAYSGGGFEIVQAIIQDTTHQSFDVAMQRLVLRPVGMWIVLLPSRCLHLLSRGPRLDTAVTAANCQAVGALSPNSRQVGCGRHQRISRGF